MSADAPSLYSLTMLRALQGRPVYRGTVPYAEKLKRRAAGKVAKASRKKNR